MLNLTILTEFKNNLTEFAQKKTKTRKKIHPKIKIKIIIIV